MRFAQYVQDDHQYVVPADALSGRRPVGHTRHVDRDRRNPARLDEGRLLLDRDLATKNVSLAEIYRQLGFEAWGAYEALNDV